MANATRTRLPATARRTQLVEAGTRAFADAGYGATSIAAIAASAGVTPRIVYQHFPSKSALYGAVLDRVAHNLDRVFAVPNGRYGIDIEALLAVARADRDGFRVLWRHAAREPQFHEVAAECRRHAVACARAGLSSWTPPDAIEWSAHAVVGYLLEAVLTWIDFGRPAADARFVRATRASLSAGVRAWASE